MLTLPEFLHFHIRLSQATSEDVEATSEEENVNRRLYDRHLPKYVYCGKAKLVLLSYS